jgi:hypothetical protein
MTAAAADGLEISESVVKIKKLPSVPICAAETGVVDDTQY